MSLTRRDFLQLSTAYSLGFAGLHTLMARSAFASPKPAQIAEGFGPLLPDPEGILNLPEGFTYHVFSRVGEEMDDGFLVPGKHDGMAAFPGPDGKTILVRNHEITNMPPTQGAFGRTNKGLRRLPKNKVYDRGNERRPALGGTTNLLYNTKTGELEGHQLSLAGTVRNCAGGPTPWNSWVTCEETVQRADQDYEKDHGFNFEVPARMSDTVVDPEPIVDMGRFNHEAIAVDPKSGIVYETEDRGDSLIYRYIPNVKGELVKGGRLQALAVKDHPSVDTRNWDDPDGFPKGKTVEVEWIDVEDVLSPEDNLRYRGFEDGAARFARGEGMWAGNDSIYFACTSGGHAEKGQIWRYTPSPHEGTEGEAEKPGSLELFVEPNDGGLIDNADNLTVSPFGDLIVCEDGSGEQFLVGVTPEGGIYKFAKNAVSDSEFAGATFSPDGSTLFVNIQGNGMTLAITGPWDQRRV